MRLPVPSTACCLLAAVLLSGTLTAQAAEPIDVNTATSEELQTLPSIGPSRAEAIIRDREANGPFRIPSDVQRVSGIGPGIMSQICPRIRAGGVQGCVEVPTREAGPDEDPETVHPRRYGEININLATVSELMLLPRIGPSRAEAIVRHRDAHGPFESPDALEAVPGIGPSTVEGLRTWVRVREDLNSTSAAYLARIPGMTPELAQAIIEERDALGGFVALESLIGVDGVPPSRLDALRPWVEVILTDAEASEGEAGR